MTLAFRQSTALPAPVAGLEVAVLGLGYVGAVSVACLAEMGHRVTGIDLDPERVAMVAAGQAPMHEAGLGDLLAEGVRAGRIRASAGGAALGSAAVILVTVGTPTGPDGGCDLSQVRAAALGIGEALRARPATAPWPLVVLRSSVPPGTTLGLFAPLIEAASGLTRGRDFGLCFQPEFLREGSALADFRAPPKTVIGALCPRSAAMLARLVAPVDAHPLTAEIAVAELAKYADNLWHATKVAFANEIGRLCKPIGVDSHQVMDLFVQDRALNLSAAYLRPGFAYGGSCLPKEIRAVRHVARALGVDLPLIETLDRSNRAQIEAALEMVRATGARRVAILGLAFKPGTDDLRESPILEVMAALAAEGLVLLAHDPVVSAATRFEAQLAPYLPGNPALAALVPRLRGLLCPDAGTAIAGAEAVIVTQATPDLRALLEASRRPVIDLCRLYPDRDDQPAHVRGIGW